METISEIVGAIWNGYKYIILGAGTGSGKSAIDSILAFVGLKDNEVLCNQVKKLI